MKNSKEILPSSEVQLLGSADDMNLRVDVQTFTSILSYFQSNNSSFSQGLFVFNLNQLNSGFGWKPDYKKLHHKLFCVALK